MLPNLKIGPLVIKNPVLMAPMCGISDSPWRRLVKGFQAGLVVTEMTSSEALIRKRDKSFQLLSYQDEEKPLVMQLSGHNAEVLAEASKMVEDLGADMVDLNMGCPVRKVVSQGAGSALLLDLKKSAIILRAMVAAVKIPVTIKIRAGWDERQKTSLEVARIAAAEGASAISIHARTRSQAFSGKADWRIIQALVEETKLPIIGNGDIQTPRDALNMFQETGCAGVMIGRGAQGRPWIFQEIMEPGYKISTELRYQTIRQHYLESLEFYGPKRGLLMMRKHLAWYSKGLPGGTEFRNTIMKLREPEPVLAELDKFFGRSQANQQAA